MRRRKKIYPKRSPEEEKHTEEILRPIKYFIGWQIFDPPTPLQRPLKTWFDVKLIVRGQSVFLYIDDELVLPLEAFLQIPTGKVGFRNNGNEKALIRDVKVTLE